MSDDQSGEYRTLKASERDHNQLDEDIHTSQDEQATAAKHDDYQRTPSPVQSDNQEHLVDETQHGEADEHDMNTTKGEELLIKDNCKAIVQRLAEERDVLLDCSLKDYQNLPSLQELAESLSDQLKHNQSFIQNLLSALTETREATESLNNVIIDKIERESVHSWLPHTDLADGAGEAEKAQVLAHAAEMRAATMRAEQQLAHVAKLCADLEEASVQAKKEAVDARLHAEQAAKRAEEAAKAAQEKEKYEQEQKRKAEETARKKAEEERIQQEMEEKKKAEREKMLEDPEEQARLNPNNWPIYIYKADGSNTSFDGTYHCVVRAMSGVMTEDDLIVSSIGQQESEVPLKCNDELISNVITIELSNEASDNGITKELKTEEPISLLIPHCAPRNPSREMVVLWREAPESEWISLESKECYIEDIKDTKFAECRPNGLGVFAVVFRLKTDHLSFTKKGGKVNSSVDPRLSIQCRAGTFKQSTKVTLQLQPVDLASVSDVKQRYPESCSHIISSSPVIDLKLPSAPLKYPMNIIVPIPANSLKLKRPVTAAPEKETKPLSRPASAAFGLGTYGTEGELEDTVHMLVLSTEDKWTVTDKIPFSTMNKKGDLVNVEAKEIPNKLWLLRMKATATVSEVELLAGVLYDYLHQRLVQVVMRQKADDLTDIAVACTNVLRLDRTLRKLEEQGYTEGTQISTEVFVMEGEAIELGFRGNLQPDEDVDLVLLFNSHIKTQLNLYITEIDKYAQKSFSSYRGFAQLFVKGIVKRDIYDETDRKKGDQRKPIGTEEVWDNVLLAELMITLPKPVPEPPKPLLRAKVQLAADGPIDDDLLRHLAADLGDEWKVLAASLNVKKTRIQSIMRNHVNDDTEQAIYEMLLTWIKRVPRCMDKVKVLCDALRGVGRVDLVEDVRDREYDYREQRADVLRENSLKLAFKKIAQNPVVLARWKDLAYRLGTGESDIDRIEDEYTSGRERCLQVLTTWKRDEGDNVTSGQLVRALKYLRLRELAAEVKRMTNYH